MSLACKLGLTGGGLELCFLRGINLNRSHTHSLELSGEVALIRFELFP